MKKYYQMRVYFDDQKGKHSELIEPFTTKYKNKLECKKATELILKNSCDYWKKYYQSAYKMAIIETTEKIVEEYTK